MTATEILARPSADFQSRLAEAQTVLARAAAEFQPITQASSLGAEDVVISHIVQSLGLQIPVFVIDTGILHTETLDLLARTKARSRVPVTVYEPDPEAVIDFLAREGRDAMYRSITLRKTCCNIRKVEPLGRALAGQRAWVTGLRREQSNARSEVPLSDTSAVAQGGPVKFNPLANWSWGDVWHYIKTNDVDYNPLHDAFYPSIGCATCTRAVSIGEDIRAGRWWWESEASKECGLHVRDRKEGIAA